MQIQNPFQEIAERLSRIENCLLDFKEAPQQHFTTIEPEPLIYGISGLAKYLQVSIPTAQKIKNSGKIPFSQVERTIIFNKADVLEALKKKRSRNG